jgi:hypothetical protein
VPRNERVKLSAAKHPGSGKHLSQGAGMLRLRAQHDMA